MDIVILEQKDGRFVMVGKLLADGKTVMGPRGILCVKCFRTVA
jgi:hypothetical protein